MSTTTTDSRRLEAERTAYLIMSHALLQAVEVMAEAATFGIDCDRLLEWDRASSWFRRAAAARDPDSPEYQRPRRVPRITCPGLL